MAKKEDAPSPTGMARMRHPESAGCSFGGRTYEAEPDGSVLVPAEAVGHLAAHGFVSVEETAGGTPAVPEEAVRHLAAHGFVSVEENAGGTPAVPEEAGSR